MNYLKILTVVSVASLVGATTVFAECSNSGYGSTNCKNTKQDYVVDKKVTKSGEDSKKEKISNVKKGENFVFSFKVTNNTDREVTVKLVDNLPSEFERVSGIGFTEDVKLSKNSSKTLEMVAKVKDSEFTSKKDFEKCVINKAYISKDNKQKDDSTATVCFGDRAKITTLPKTGSNELLLGVSLFTTALGLGLRRFRK